MSAETCRGAGWVALWVLIAGCAPSASLPPPRPTAESARAESAEDLYRRGRAFAQLGDLVRAEQYLAGALEQGTAPRTALPVLLKVCVASGRHRAALLYAREYGTSLEAEPKFQLIVALLEIEVGDPAVALRLLRQTVARDGANAEAHYQLATLLERLEGGATEESERHQLQYLELAPNGPHAAELQSKLERAAALKEDRRLFSTDQGTHGLLRVREAR